MRLFLLGKLTNDFWKSKLNPVHTTLLNLYVWSLYYPRETSQMPVKIVIKIFLGISKELCLFAINFKKVFSIRSWQIYIGHVNRTYVKLWHVGIFKKVIKDFVWSLEKNPINYFWTYFFLLLFLINVFVKKRNVITFCHVSRFF